MPLTQLANTSIDRIAPDPSLSIEALLAYAGTDLVCYRAEAPQSLAERQHTRWQPLLAWLAERHGAALAVYQGVMPRPQPEPAIDALRRHLAALSPFALAGLAAASQTCGSLVIAMALADGRVTAGEAFELSELDESFQIERWGEDSEAAKRRLRLRRDIGGHPSLSDAFG